MNIVFFETTGRDKRYFQSKLTKHNLIFNSEPLSLTNYELALQADVISVFICSKINAEVLKKLPSLKGIVTRSTGTDHIDKDYCAKKQLPVLNVPRYGINTVAEHTFALILALSRKLYLSIQHTKEGDFENDDLTGFDLFNKTLGIVGFGGIGSRVAEIAQAFGMKILVHTRTQKDLPHIKFVELNELLREADIVTLHTPLTPETKHIINKNNIGLLKKGALIINTARGPLIETQALVKALEEKQLAGAGLDVLEEEATMKAEHQLAAYQELTPTATKTLLLDHILLEMPNVIITPHNAFNSKEAIREINEISAANIEKISQA